MYVPLLKLGMLNIDFPAETLTGGYSIPLILRLTLPVASIGTLTVITAASPTLISPTVTTTKESYLLTEIDEVILDFKYLLSPP